MPFSFVHTADIHLDSPLRSLALRDPGLAELIGNATRQAFERTIDLCLDERVDALAIAGDLYDGEQTSIKTALFLAAFVVAAQFFVSSRRRRSPWKAPRRSCAPGRMW